MTNSENIEKTENIKEVNHIEEIEKVEGEPIDKPSSIAPPKEQLYSTKEAASMIGLSPDVFRYYASTYKDYLPPIIELESGHQQRRGNLRFTSEHIKLVDKIYGMTRNGYSKSQIIQYLTDGILNEDGEYLIHKTVCYDYLDNDDVRKLWECSLKLGFDKGVESQKEALEIYYNNNLLPALEQINENLVRLFQDNTSSKKQLLDMEKSKKEAEQKNELLEKELNRLLEQENINAQKINDLTKEIDRMRSESKSGFFSRLFKKI